MSRNSIPKDNSLYSDVNYWNKRYETEETYDWLIDYATIKHVINCHLKKTDSILIIGCGNSLMSEEMTADGFHHIHNIDFSDTVIRRMSSHCDKCRQMEWSVMDASQLAFRDNAFDAVIEKATIDSFLSMEKSQWDISECSKSRVTKVLSEISRVLHDPKGQFLSISYAQPHFRIPLYNEAVAKSQINMTMTKFYELGTHFHYYCYNLKKGTHSAQLYNGFAYEPPKVIPCNTNGATESSHDHSVNPLFNIEL